MAEEKTAIRIDHVSKTYENTKSDDNEYVLKDISIDVKENEFVCVLMPWLTVKKNIMMGPSLHHKSKIVCEEIADKYIQMVGLKGMENYYPKQLSGGMAQRVGIARALANEPDIVLMDEPLGALDAMTRENMRQEILKIWQKTRTTVFFITHSVQEAVYLADRVIVLKGGGVDCDVHIDIDRPRNMKSEKFMEYIGFFEKKLSNGVVTSD